MQATCRRPQMSRITLLSCLIWTWALASWPILVGGMRGSRVRELREETEQMFYHGFDNYMKHAFPEDELRPVTCGPLTRDRADPTHIALNDVLGNYSLTLIDSLSTLAILSSADGNRNSSAQSSGERAWSYFQNGVRDLVELYGDGSDGPRGVGTRGRGFELDSKVQVFETVIRGLGGLLSAHLFAVGDLPVRGYSPSETQANIAKRWPNKGGSGIRWDNGFEYDGQLLRLAMDLGKRLLPAFYTPTGLPYPRVNLRDGVPFYTNSPLNTDGHLKSAGNSQDSAPEITETCSAGAGSLVLEFTVLSRLTGDSRFEELAKRAFWAVWARRTNIGLIGGGIDAESGRWVNTYTGIGAGIDSFFEYALKSHILLSGAQPMTLNTSHHTSHLSKHYAPLTEEENSPASFLETYQEALEAIKHHLYRGSSYQYPHYIQGDILTGATRAFWIDSLSAYFPGILTLAGDLDGATEAHLLNAALWTRFSALPERWNVATGDIDSGLRWWGGRPEFIESNYYLYRATGDPWYLYVGEMVMRDIKRRCWTKCGWAGLQDVNSGELSDRMESFFLGETTKYLYLLFEPDHPLNRIDAPFVFSTEGHPLIVPRVTTHSAAGDMHQRSRNVSSGMHTASRDVCHVPTPSPPFGLSITAARPDIFHAASLARLHLRPKQEDTEAAIVEFGPHQPSVSVSDLYSPSNYTFFPWTLPNEVVAPDATSRPMAIRPTLDLSFPPLPNSILSPASLKRVEDGVLIKSVSGLRLGMIQDIPLVTEKPSDVSDGYRIQVINNVPLGKDELVYIPRETTNAMNPTDPHFTRVQDATMLDIVIDVDVDEASGDRANSTTPSVDNNSDQGPVVTSQPVFDDLQLDGSNMRLVLSSLMQQVTSLLREDALYPASKSSLTSSGRSAARIVIPAITSTGNGAVPPPEVDEAQIPEQGSTSNAAPASRLLWSNIYVADELCDERLPASVPRTHQIIVVKRGKCSFSQKLRNIPSFRPSRSSLQLVIVVSYPPEEDHHGPQSGSTTPPSESTSSATSASYTDDQIDLDDSWLIRPLLDEIQVVAGGIPRPHPISMVMVGGGDKTYNYFRQARGSGIRRRYEIRSQGIPISNLIVI